MLVILRISKLYKRIFSFTKSGLINEIKVLADAELVHSLESLQATDSPTAEPTANNPLLEAAGITCEVPQTQSNGSDVTARPQFGPSLVPPNTASGKIIQMPQRKII